MKSGTCWAQIYLQEYSISTNFNDAVITPLSSSTITPLATKVALQAVCSTCFKLVVEVCELGEIGLVVKEIALTLYRGASA